MLLEITHFQQKSQLTTVRMSDQKVCFIAHSRDLQHSYTMQYMPCSSQAPLINLQERAIIAGVEKTDPELQNRRLTYKSECLHDNTLDILREQRRLLTDADWHNGFRARHCRAPSRLHCGQGHMHFSPPELYLKYAPEASL